MGTTGKLKSGRKHVRNKGKRWKKGQSCSSNPETTKFRSAAKTRFFNVNTGPSNLTTTAIAKHNANSTENVSDAVSHMSLDEGDNQSFSGNTFNTWASNWTDCTNATFSQVHRYVSSNSAMHKEILAVLAAVTEVIKESGGKETETEYFAALMTAMESAESDESLSAITYLISLVIKRLPVSVLKARFSVFAKAFVDVLATNSDTENPSLLRSVLMCLAALLRVQDRGVWSDASTMQVYSGMLTFLMHQKPKVRKASQHAVGAILKGSTFMTQGDPPAHHPAAAATAKYCVQQIEENGGSSDVTVTLHILGVLKEVMGIFPHASLKLTCETILKVMTLSNVMVTSVAMQALHSMFLAEPKEKSLPAQLNAQLITALYDYQPSEGDVQPMMAWMAVLEKAHHNLTRLDEKLCLSHLPKIFKKCMALLLTEKPEVRQAAAKTMKALLKSCVAPIAETAGKSLAASPAGGATPVHKLFESIEGGLSYQYHAAWGLVLQVFSITFEVLGKHCHSIMRKSLLSLADLRDSHRFSYKSELEYALGAAIRAMGPRVVLEAVPLGITGLEDNYDFPRSWLVPVLRDNIRETELAFFVTYFLPLAAKLRQRSTEYSKAGRVVEAKTYATLQTQIWSLLPGFCTRPTDLVQSFKGIAKIMGTAIADREDLRLEVMSSLRKLILHSAEKPENRAELAKFGKNFLPILFNLFTTDPEKEQDPARLAVLDTVKVYLQIADAKLVADFFDKCHGKMLDASITAFRRHALMDLALGMTAYLDSTRLSQLLEVIRKFIQKDAKGLTYDRTVEKKSFRILEEMCDGKSINTREFMNANLPTMQEMLVKSLSSSSPSSRAPRLRCLVQIMKHLEPDQKDFISSVVPEAILCTKAVAEKARAAAYTLLVEMANTMIRLSEEPRKLALQDFIELVLAGLGGSPHMVATSTLALTRIIFTFKADISDDVLSILMDNTCLLLKSKAREIVDAALGFLKVLLSAFSEGTMAKHLKELVTSLVSMKDDNKHHFRFKAKEIYTKLIRKFGFNTVQSLVPNTHHKILANIRKTLERSKKKKEQSSKDDEEEDDSEDDDGYKDTAQSKQKIASIEDILRDTDSELEADDDDVNAAGKGKKSKAKKASKEPKSEAAAWLREGAEDEDIVDFLDPSIVKKITATKPLSGGESVKRSVQHNFKTAPDGRFIIKEDDDEEEEEQPQSREDMQQDVDDLLDAMGGYKRKGRKRSIEDDDDDEDESPMKYQAGGTGIHRPLAVPKKKIPAADPGAEYKSKKAGGDVKRKDKPDPYAYVPLNVQQLNRRKKAKMSGHFKNLVRGAQKGATKGKKQKSRQK